MSFIIAFIGLPASGKSYYSREIAKKFGYPLFEGPATQILSEGSYATAGFRLPYEFDEKVFEIGVGEKFWVRKSKHYANFILV